MDKRQHAIAELKEQIRLARERLGPEKLRELEKMVKAAAGGQGPASDSVPYDRAAAGKALELFLRNHADPEGMKKKILALLQKSTQ